MSRQIAGPRFDSLGERIHSWVIRPGNLEEE